MLRYPINSEGYAEAVCRGNIVDTMNKYGVVVIQVLSADECIKTETALWKENGDRLRADDYTTWENENWPSPAHPFLSDKYALHEQAFRNRVNPKVVDAFIQLYKTDDLLTTVDFWGIKRGTVFGPDEQRIDWRPKPLKLHWDVDLITYNKQKKQRYQALVAIVNCNQEVGSFSCVPGSCYIDYSKHQENHKYVKKTSVLQRQVQRIPLRAGDMVIWDMGIAHANYANYTNTCRLTQYMRMVPRVWAALEKQVITEYWRKMPGLKDELKQKQWTNDEKRWLGLNKI
jgi:hypothetical protein